MLCRNYYAKKAYKSAIIVSNPRKNKKINSQKGHKYFFRYKPRLDKIVRLYMVYKLFPPLLRLGEN